MASITVEQLPDLDPGGPFSRWAGDGRRSHIQPKGPRFVATVEGRPPYVLGQPWPPNHYRTGAYLTEEEARADAEAWVAEQLPVIDGFVVVPSAIHPGGRVRLLWTTRRAASVTIDGAAVAASGESEMVVAEDVSIVLEVENDFGRVTATRTVAVGPQALTDLGSLGVAVIDSMTGHDGKLWAGVRSRPGGRFLASLVSFAPPFDGPIVSADEGDFALRNRSEQALTINSLASDGSDLYAVVRSASGRDSLYRINPSNPSLSNSQYGNMGLLPSRNNPGGLSWHNDRLYWTTSDVVEVLPRRGRLLFNDRSLGRPTYPFPEGFGTIATASHGGRLLAVEAIGSASVDAQEIIAVNLDNLGQNEVVTIFESPPHLRELASLDGVLYGAGGSGPFNLNLYRIDLP